MRILVLGGGGFLGHHVVAAAVAAGHAVAYWGFPLLARLLRVHRIVREDGRVSIARSRRPDEWRAALQAAGIAPDEVRIVRRFPFRLCVERLRA